MAADPQYINQLFAEFDKQIPQLNVEGEEVERQRQAFVNYFTPAKLAAMTEAEYYLGKIEDGVPNFSHDIERTLEKLGSISGRPGASTLFGVWFSKADNQYKISQSFKKRGYTDHKKAFIEVKRLLGELYNAGNNGDLELIVSNPLDDWLKGKFLSVYFPEKYLNLFFLAVLRQSADYLGVAYNPSNAAYIRNALVEFKNNHPIAKKWPLRHFGNFLWNLDLDGTPGNALTDGADLEEEFIQYLTSTVRSSGKSEPHTTDMLIDGQEARQIALYTEVDKLLESVSDQTSEQWQHIESIFKISASSEIMELMNDLFRDRMFTAKDREPQSRHFRSNAIKYYYCFLKARELFGSLIHKGSDTSEPDHLPTGSLGTEVYNLYLAALRTKPFMLLAGISGTGKSRIVREMAFRSCPDKDDLRSSRTTPGNYLMVEVKPNWHDSTELLGYYSNITNQYILTPFIKFLVKAKKYPHVPFFVCLDEMNLAPVEQYFAEVLSLMETRKKVGDTITTGVLLKKEHLAGLGETEDLMLPPNVFIVGTVNMDDTTHQFSRKVIDRAMTIEMNGGKFTDMFGRSSDLEYAEGAWSMDKELLVRYVTADEVLAAHPKWEEKIKTLLPERLDAINKCLKGTPFEVSYRVLNELVIYLGVLMDDYDNDTEEDFNRFVEMALDRILLMKVLPRIEGDSEMFQLTREEQGEHSFPDKLSWLEDVSPSIETDDDNTATARKKIAEMIGRLDNGFTRFWP